MEKKNSLDSEKITINMNYTYFIKIMDSKIIGF